MAPVGVDEHAMGLGVGVTAAHGSGAGGVVAEDAAVPLVVADGQVCDDGPLGHEDVIIRF